MAVKDTYRKLNDFILDYQGEMPEELKNLLKDAMHTIESLELETEELSSNLEYAETQLDIYRDHFGSIDPYSYLI